MLLRNVANRAGAARRHLAITEAQHVGPHLVGVFAELRGARGFPIAARRRPSRSKNRDDDPAFACTSVEIEHGYLLPGSQIRAAVRHRDHELRTEQGRPQM